jgi:hypothetical protein
MGVRERQLEGMVLRIEKELNMDPIMMELISIRRRHGTEPQARSETSIIF